MTCDEEIILGTSQFSTALDGIAAVALFVKVSM